MSTTTLEGFLHRVIPPGNYSIIAYNKTPTASQKDAQWGYRSFAATDHAGAAGYARFCVRKGFEVYHALAAYIGGDKRATRAGKEFIDVRRVQSNVQAIRVFTIDCDVARPGDGKKNTFASRRDALAWLNQFCAASAMPLPNLVVSSGYGLHLYWVVEQALTPSAWQPLADALLAAARAHGYTGDSGRTVDCAGILRPPETLNLKGGGSVPVKVIEQFTAANYQLHEIQTALTPWVALKATGTHGPVPVPPVATSATVHQLGPKPAHVGAGQGPQINANASAGLDSAQREYLFARIGTKCAQVGGSLATGGLGDGRDKWRLGHLTLAHFCADGEAHAHLISQGDPRYTHAEVEKMRAQIAAKAMSSALGPPKCASYEAWDPAPCVKCPLKGRQVSPLTLGAEDGDLPEFYRRAEFPTRIEKLTPSGKSYEWVTIMRGDVHSPRLDALHQGYRLTFSYELAGTMHAVAVRDFDMAHGPTIQAHLGKQGISVDRHQAGPAGDFAVAWINKLREQRAQQHDQLRPFGWNFDAQGERVGLAIAGTHYRRDGTTEYVPGGDVNIMPQYTPTGTLARWRAAASLFEGKRPDLQTLIAMSFAAPLISLAGDVRGMSFNFWSPASGVGKTTALKVGQAVWGDYRMLQAMKDTPNSVMRSLSIPRVLVRYWDELRIAKEWHQSFSDLIFQIPMGREKARLGSDIQLRDVGEWETILCFTSNRSAMDWLINDSTGTDAGMARLFECRVAKVTTPFNSNVGPVFKELETNYGHAGATYAKYLATHVPGVTKLIGMMMAMFAKDLNMQQEERFYVAGMACCFAGATLARQLGLFDFDLKGIDAYLRQEFLHMRAGRVNQTVMTSSGGYDIEEILNQFLYEQADYRLQTSTLARVGAGKVDVKGRPRTGVVRFQVVESPAMLRLSRQAFTSWLHDHNYPARSVVEAMKDAWSAVEHRQTIGGGTDFRGGQIWVLDVNLVGPLASHLYGPGSDNVDPVHHRARTSPAASVAGNQARV